MRSLLSEYFLFLWKLTITFLACYRHGVSGGVEIVKPYHPLYVKVGSSLIIACESQERVDLTWYQQTPQTSWTDVEVQPRLGSNIVIQSFKEEPSGFTRSTLVKRNMSLSDRGTYICQDKSSKYAVWVTVLHISARYLTDVSAKVSPLILGCSISGFDTNVPTIDYDWIFKDSFIPHPHHKVAALVRHAPSRLASIDKYRVSMENNDLRLEIYDPNSLDGGLYNCTFTLSTNLGPVTFNESLYIDGSRLPLRSAGTVQSFRQCVPLSVTFLVVVISFIK